MRNKRTLLFYAKSSERHVTSVLVSYISALDYKIRPLHKDFARRKADQATSGRILHQGARCSYVLKVLIFKYSAKILRTLDIK